MKTFTTDTQNDLIISFKFKKLEIFLILSELYTILLTFSYLIIGTTQIFPVDQIKPPKTNVIFLKRILLVLVR